MRVVTTLSCQWLLLALSVQAAAQTLDSQVVQAVDAAQRVRVRLASGERGTLYGPAIDSAGLSYHASRLTGGGSTALMSSPVPMARITQIQVPHGSHAARGAKIGGAVGLALALIAVAATAGNDFTSPTPDEAGRAIVGLTVIGAGAGALIGSTSSRWATVYRATAPPAGRALDGAGLWTELATPPDTVTGAHFMSRVVLNGQLRLDRIGGAKPGNHWQYSP